MLSSNGIFQARVATSFLFSLPACDRDAGTGRSKDSGGYVPLSRKRKKTNNHERCLQIEASL